MDSSLLRGEDEPAMVQKCANRNDGLSLGTNLFLSKMVAMSFLDIKLGTSSLRLMVYFLVEI